MLLTLIVILILIWSAVVGSLYSNFLVFYKSFTETENYHKARYASIAATERAELVVKQREPWYIWSWWWILGESSFTWNSPSDNLISSFSYLSNEATTPNKSSIFRKIDSRTDRIPSEWKWNVDKLLSTDDSPNYNMMDYENAEVFLLYYDNLGGGNPYKKRDCSDSSHCEKADITEINGWIRLPQLIYQKFWALDDDHSLSPEWYIDDALVDRQLRWNFKTWDQVIPFTLFATQSAAWSSATNKDSAIRESNLNNSEWAWLELEFSNLRRDPRKHSTAALPTIVSQSSNEIIDLTDRNDKFNTFFSNGQFSLLNLVLWGWRLAKRYPFLEYYLDFWNTVSDKYFTIETEWNFWDYKIDNVLYKPTITESILRSFTTIF